MGMGTKRVNNTKLNHIRSQSGCNTILYKQRQWTEERTERHKELELAKKKRKTRRMYRQSSDDKH